MLLSVSIHRGCVICCLKSNFVFVNKTLVPVCVKPLICSASLQAPDSHMMPDADHVTSDHANMTVSSEEFVPVFAWNKIEGEKLIFALQLSGDSAPSSTSHLWSIPLSLNFVRHSFSLPQTTPTSLFCILTTHVSNEVTYVVLAEDTAPRLILTNTLPHPLLIREANSRGIHSHPQTLYPNVETSYEPPSLAILYPLIKGISDEEKFEFKTVSEIKFQIGIGLDASPVWSEPIKLQYSQDLDIAIPGCCSVVVRARDGNRTVNVVITPAEGLESREILASPSAHCKSKFAFLLNIEQLIISMDYEDASRNTISPVLRLTTEGVAFGWSQSTAGREVSATAKSIQLDNLGNSSLYDVVLLPRRSHYPPAQLVKTPLSPYVSLSFHLSSSNMLLFETARLTVAPTTIQVDSQLIQQLVGLVQSYGPPQALAATSPEPANVAGLAIPALVLREASRDWHPLVVRDLVIDTLTLYITARLTHRVSVVCDDSKLSVEMIRLENVYSNFAELSQSLAVHYATELAMQAGWLITSLDFIGSPGMFVSSVAAGLHDMFYLPYEGLTRGPGYFILGLGQGMSSLISGVSGGAIRSVTNFASSVAKNIERLSLDSDHVSYQEDLRRRAQSSPLGSSIVMGASSFGISLVGAIAGVIDQPMQSVHQTQPEGVMGYTKSMLAGVGKGLLGVVTKPVGGMFQLVSQTGHGLLNTTGLVHKTCIKVTPLDALGGKLDRANLLPSCKKYSRYSGS